MSEQEILERLARDIFTLPVVYFSELEILRLINKACATPALPDDVAGLIEESQGKADAAQAMIKALCQPRGSEGSREWIMSVPARPDYDPDLVIGLSVQMTRRLANVLDSLSRERAVLANLLRQCAIDRHVSFCQSTRSFEQCSLRMCS